MGEAGAAVQGYGRAVQGAGEEGRARGGVAAAGPSVCLNRA
jgi:hypothetical protein